MSYTGHKKYKSRFEKKQERKKNFRSIFVAFLICLAIYLFMKREDIYLYVKTFFY